MAPSSSSNSAKTALGPVTLALSKFSFCTIAGKTSPVPWTHIIGQGDLFAVFDDVRRLDISEQVIRRRLFKVAYRGDLLESVELESLRAQAEADRMLERTQHLADIDRNTVFVMKGSQKTLAFMYRTVDRKIRRVQLRFQTESSFEVGVHELASFALPITDKDIPTRPATIEGVYLQPVHPSQGYPGSQGGQGRCLEPQFQPFQAVQPVVTASDEQHFQHYRMIEAANLQNTRAQISQAWHPSTSTLDKFVSSSSQVSVDDSQNPGFGGSLPQPITQRPPIFQPIVSRPFSAPQRSRPITESYTLEEMLPPIRELPFGKDKAKPLEKATEQLPKAQAKAPAKRKQPTVTRPRKRPAKDSKMKRAQSTIAAAVIEPAPASSARPSRDKESLHTDHLPSSSAPPRITREPEMEGNDLVDPIQSTPATPTPSRSTPALPNPRHTEHENGPESPQKRQPLAQTSHNQASKGVQAGVSGSQIGPDEAMAQLETWIQKYHDCRAPAPPKTTKALLAEFAAKSDSERVKLVDEKIVEYLQDENFMQLLKDVEKTWKRVMFE